MYGVVLHAHAVRGESHNQRNTTGEVATALAEDIEKQFRFTARTVGGTSGAAVKPSSNVIRWKLVWRFALANKDLRRHESFNI